MNEMAKFLHILRVSWMSSTLLQVLVPVICIVATVPFVQSRSFTIDYTNNTFLKDGRPFRYISGSIHYNRVPRIHWKDRLLKMYAAGLNTIQTYVPWNFHQPKPFVSDFTGDLDMVSFLKLAQEIGFVVILRPGPYTDAGWDFGGLPAWFMESRFINQGLVVRTNSSVYMQAVRQWYGELLPLIRPLLYCNGGPVVTIQVENEYGSYFACDHNYIKQLRDLMRDYLGNDIVLFTTDGSSVELLKCGTIEGVYATIDFGLTDDPEKAFAPQRQFEPQGPLVCSEFYVETYLECWGLNHTLQSPDAAAKGLDILLAYGANVNMYMFEGGTNFGYTAGGFNDGKPPCISVATTYDHDAPMSEAGDPREKYFAIRDVILKYVSEPSVPVLPATPKFSYAPVKMKLIGSLTELLDVVSPGFAKFVYPVPMEDVQQYRGFALYRHVSKANYVNLELQVDGVRDRGYVLVNNARHDILNRLTRTRTNITLLRGDNLDILVENQGHTFFGNDLTENQKGIIKNVALGNTTLTDWIIYPIELENVFNISELRPPKPSRNRELRTPSVYAGSFQIPDSLSEPLDTYIDMRPWHKGQVFINGFNVGTYWPSLGPQVTLYVPKSCFKPYPAYNTIVAFELEYSPCFDYQPCFATFVDKPFLNKTVITFS